MALVHNCFCEMDMASNFPLTPSPGCYGTTTGSPDHGYSVPTGLPSASTWNLPRIKPNFCAWGGGQENRDADTRVRGWAVNSSSVQWG